MGNNKFYIIYRNKHGSGFFSNFFHVLGHLIIAEQKGLIPVVDMENYLTFYNEKELIYNTKNSWEYYFKQVSPYSLDEAYNSEYILCGGEFPMFIYDLINCNGKLVSDLVRKYIYVQDDIMNDVKKFIIEYFDKCNKILGVHFRGWEMAAAENHPIPPSLDQMMNCIYTMLYKYNIEKIFLSTEQSDYLEVLKYEFGDKLLYTNYYRTTQGVNAYKLNKYPRKLHMYKLGREVLVDAIILSRTDYFLAGGQLNYDNVASSNVAIAAQIMNNTNYKQITLIKNGYSGKWSRKQKIFNKFKKLIN